MRKIAKKSKIRFPGFTLIELLTVMAIIVILAGLVLMSAGWAQKKAASSRAEAEIQAMSAACESYKADQGIYPTPISQLVGSGSSPNINPSSYKTVSRALYQALSGDGDDALVTPGTASDGVLDSGTSAKTQYMEFKSKMLGGLSTTTPPQVIATSYIQDPFGYSYGYYAPNLSGTGGITSGTTVVYNPTFDLWSTAGSTGLTGSPATLQSTQARWIKNW